MGLPAYSFIGNWSAYLDSHGAPRRVQPPAYLAKRPTKCASCGSREFKEHGGQMVCRYCRGVG